MDLLPQFLSALHDLRLPGPADAPARVLIGLSGGPDSLAMLHLFTRVPAGLEVHALHLHHGIRGADADADAAFCAEVAAAWGVPIHVARADVPALAARAGLSLEEAARQARYTALARHALAIGASRIAVAHNADDQAETVLMHLLRGAGLAGLRGMLPAAPLSEYHLLEPLAAPLTLIRPLLGIPRADIEAYCAAQELSPRFDRSNLDTTLFRNRLRHEVLPYLERINPNLRDLLVRTASVLAADYEVIAAQAEVAWNAAVREVGGGIVALDRAAWAALPLALQRAVIRRTTWVLRPDLRDVTFEHVAGAVRVAAGGEVGAQATLPGGLMLRVGYDVLTVAVEDAEPPAPDWPLLPPGAALSLPDVGESVLLPGGDWRLRLAAYDGPREGAEWAALLADRWAAPFDAGALRGPLVLRTRRPGDRFHPMGAGGGKKLAEFQIDRKVPARLRERLPLLVCGDRIAWVCGWRVDERFAVRPATEAVVVARFERATADNA